MKILLTGSTGFLGKYIKYALSNHEVITLGRSSCNINFDEKFTISSLPNFNLVIHAAGKAHSIPETLEEKKEFYDSNLTLTLNLLDSLELSEKPSFFVFISSVSVYGLNDGENINENYPLLAEDPYGQSKIEAEMIVKKWCYEHNVICTILRLPLVVGENPPGNLGAMIRGIKKGYYFNIAGGNAKKKYGFSNRCC
jgi:nucleoside-diphosphate-sugar epimerase